MQFLSTGPLRVDPRNHTIPHVRILTSGDWVFIVQATWSPYWDDPPFDTLQTRLEMARQLLEVLRVFFYQVTCFLNHPVYIILKGLVFMHENGVGHGVRV
jgi:hypothetical protein